MQPQTRRPTRSSPWTIPELQILLQNSPLNSARTSEALSSKGFTRSPNDIETLYHEHRNFITLNKQCTAEGLWAVIQDRANLLQSGGVSALPQRQRKRPKQLQYDFLPRRKGDTKKQARPAPKKSKFKRKREVEGAYLLKSGGRPYQRIKLLQQNQNQTTGCLKKARNPIQFYNEGCWLLVESQYFVPTLDQVFIKTNEFKQMLNVAKIDYSAGLTRQEWAYIRKAIGKPPLFNQEFLQAELQRLQASRRFCRNYMNNSTSTYLNKFSSEPGLVEILKGIRQFEVNQIVLARHPICYHLHYGLIFSKTKQNTLMIKFFVPELGVQKVPDHWVCDLSQTSFVDRPVAERVTASEKHMSDSQSIVNELDFKATAFAFKLLESKYKLLTYYKQNCPSQSSAEFKWLYQMVESIDMALRSVLTKFRLRGVRKVNVQNQQIPQLISNTLKYIQKELESGMDPADQKSIEKAKTIIADYQEREVSNIVSRLLPSPPEGEVGRLIKTLLGILASFKVGGKLLTSTRQFKQLVDMIHDKYPQHLNQINDMVFKISSKIK